MRSAPRRLPQGALDYGMHIGLRHGRDSRRARLIAQQTVKAFLGNGLLPASNRGPANADPLGNFQDSQTVSREQDDGASRRWPAPIWWSGLKVSALSA
jgi:hypothetical protein